MLLNIDNKPFLSLTEMLLVIVVLAVIIVCLLTLELYLDLKRTKAALSIKDEQQAVRKTTWFDLFRRKGITMDKFVEGHNYDGIQEYDNSPPAWFNWLFYTTVVAAFCYMMYFHVLKIGDLQLAEYDKQLKEAAPILAKAQEKAIYLADQPKYSDPANLEKGKIVFATNCVICHGDHAQGNIGPNLTDQYWLHGGKYKQVFTTIFNGVPEKGMLSWKKTLKPDDIRAVASYVYSLKGSNPANPKAPQGDRESDSTRTGSSKSSTIQ